MSHRMLVFGLLVPCALSAQTSVIRVLMDQDTATAPPPAALCILETGNGHGFAASFGALLQTPDLRVYRVPVRRITAGSPEEKAFRTRYRLPPAPQWALVDARTEALLSHGAHLPAAGPFAQTLEQAGFRDRAKELRAYIKRNPQVIEAREQLLDLLRQRGEAAAQQFLGIEAPSPRDRLERGDLAGALAAVQDPDPADLSSAKKLDPVQDLEAWSAFAQAFDEAFRGGGWREMAFTWTKEGRALDRGSPTLQGLYLRWLPAVEAAMREEPDSVSLWNLWAWMSRALGDRPIRPLLESLRPSPLTPKGDWPPARAARRLLATASSPADWLSLKEHYQALWEGEPHALRGAPEKSELPLEQDWEEGLGPLLECCLRSHDTAQADAYLREAVDASRWPGLAAKAALLANRCGQPELATRWRALRPGGSR
ncbi:MAG TPA: hypothetical protein VFF76_11100 [Holophagaceae bacterium]|jgi:hypothetical protein|nr:hypothetical protein [Holophagaceae bacterium]